MEITWKTKKKGWPDLCLILLKSIKILFKKNLNILNSYKDLIKSIEILLKSIKIILKYIKIR